MTTSRALSNRQIIQAAAVVLLGFLASGVLGLVRTAAFSAAFGTSAELDAFYAAQRIPEMLFTLVAGGALGSSFIPVFSRYLSANDLDGAWRLASAVMTLSALAAAVLAVLLALFAPVLVPVLLVPGATNAEQALTTSLTQLMLVTTVIFAISGLLMGILNAHQRFLFPALALSLNNVGLIIGALILTRLLPAQAVIVPSVFDGLSTSEMLIWSPSHHVNIYGLALGAVLGATLHLLIQLPGVFGIKARLRLLVNWRVPGTLEVLGLMGPRVLGLAVVQINFVVNIAFASAMVEGSQTALQTAWFLMFFTLGVIAQSVGTAVFPSLSALAAENDIAGYKGRLSTALRSVLFFAFPASIGLILLGEPAIAVLFERGAWTSESTQATAWALNFLAIGIAGHSLLEVLSRAFYALSDTWTPVRIGIASMVSNIVLSFVFIQFIGDPLSLARGPFAGLALANSVTTLLEGAALWWLLRRRIGDIQDRYVLDGAVRALVAALGMGVVIWLIGQVMTSALTWMLVGGIVGSVSFFGLAILLRLEEVSIVTRRLVRRR
ncbi:MAG: murein biosynthesis integral membrane protein MurJ [Anaerolineae bacterium]